MSLSPRPRRWKTTVPPAAPRQSAPLCPLFAGGFSWCADRPGGRRLSHGHLRGGQPLPGQADQRPSVPLWPCHSHPVGGGAVHRQLPHHPFGAGPQNLPGQHAAQLGPSSTWATLWGPRLSPGAMSTLAGFPPTWLPPWPALPPPNAASPSPKGWCWVFGATSSCAWRCF